MFFCISVFVTLAHAASSFKSLNHEIKFKKKNWPTKDSREKNLTREILTRKNFGLARKFWTHEIPTRKNFRPTKYPQEKNFEPTKYPRENILDPRNTHEKKFWTH